MTQLTRRTFLGVAGASAVCGITFFVIKKFSPFGALFTRDRTYYISPQGDLLGKKFFVGLVDATAMRFYAIPVDFEGHSILLHPTQPSKALMLGQRPGRMSCELDLVQKTVVRNFPASNGRYFYGHGAYSADGRYLFLTENNLSSGEGLITVRDSKDYSVLGEYPSYGTGPHEMLSLDEGKIFAVANGGNTHEIGASTKVEESSVCFIEARSGKLLQKQISKFAHLSPRHLAKGPGVSVILAAQYLPPQKDPKKWPKSLPLIGLSKLGSDVLHWFDLPAELTYKMRYNVLSVSTDDSGKIAVATSPGGNIVTLWDIEKEKHLSSIEVEKPMGVSKMPDGKTFFITASNGASYELKNGQLKAIDLASNKVPWGSHLTRRQIHL